MRKIINLFLVLSLSLGLVPNGGSIVVYPFLERYMSEISKTSPQLYDQLTHQKNLPSSFCGLKGIMKSTVPEGMAATHDRINVDPIFSTSQIRSLTPSYASHKLIPFDADILPCPVFKRIPTPPPKTT